MKFPSSLRLLGCKAGQDANDFALGWAEGLARWRSIRNDPEAIAAARSRPGSFFPFGSVAFAASEAAVAYMIGLNTKESAR